MPSFYRDPDGPAPNASRRVGVTALVERGGEVLVERRVDDADEWAFVGGTVEEDEDVLHALRREVGEETGLEVADARLLGVFSDPSRIVAYRDGTVCRFISIAFRVVPRDAGEPRPSDESAGMRFVSRDELAQLPFWPAHRPLRDALLRDPPGTVVE
jgi:ADP-ribose pyrophosphatase YjhB (NUDIX family)